MNRQPEADPWRVLVGLFEAKVAADGFGDGFGVDSACHDHGSLRGSRLPTRSGHHFFSRFPLCDKS